MSFATGHRGSYIPSGDVSQREHTGQKSEGREHAGNDGRNTTAIASPADRRSSDRAGVTYRVDLEVVQARRGEERLAHHLHLLEPLPAGRLRDGVVVEEHARVVGEARADRAHDEHRRAEALVREVQALVELALEDDAVEERHEDVRVREVFLDERRE